MSEYAGSKYERKPHGVVVVGGEEKAHTRQCVHCGCHWRSIASLDTEELHCGRFQPKLRGFCYKCMGPTCGPLCHRECIPWQKKNEMIEKGIPLIQAF